MGTMRKIRIKRIYAPPEPGDGYRILVDRMWPRGIAKEKAIWHLWLKGVAPSIALRKWFNHDPKKWEGFKKKYREELSGAASFAELEKLIHHHPRITLLYSAKDEKHNQAAALLEILQFS